VAADSSTGNATDCSTASAMTRGKFREIATLPWLMC
jgi:hypothetical protein